MSEEPGNAPDWGDESCLDRLGQAYGSLGKTARKVADSIRRQPEDVVGLSITALANRSGVSETTVLRLVRSLGYTGYREFSLALAAAVGVRDESEFAIEVDESDELAILVDKVFSAEARALAIAPRALDSGELRAAVDALSAARRVHLYAVGGSGLLAVEAEYRLMRIGLDCIAIHDPVQIASQATKLTSGDVALGITQTGRTRATIEGLRIAREGGATTIAITGTLGSQIQAVSDIALVLAEVHTAYRGALLDSKIAELTLIDALAACVARQVGQPAGDGAARLEENIESACFVGS